MKMDIYENMTNMNICDASDPFVKTDNYSTDVNDNVVNAFDDDVYSDGGWDDDDFADSDDENDEALYGNTSSVVEYSENDAPPEEEGFYDLPADESRDSTPPDIVRSLKPETVQRQCKPPKPKSKPSVKQTVGQKNVSYDNHKLKIPPQVKKKPVTPSQSSGGDQKKMLNPVARKSKFLEHLSSFNRNGSRPPSVANKKQTLSISPPKPHMVCGRPYVPPVDDEVLDESIYEVENECRCDDDVYIDPSDDPAMASCPLPSRALPTTPDAMSGRTFLQRLDTIKQNKFTSQKTFQNQSSDDFVEESEYEVFDTNNESSYPQYNSSKNSSSESSGDSCDISMSLSSTANNERHNEHITESNEYELLTETQKHKPQPNARPNISNRPPLPTPHEKPTLPRTSPVVKKTLSLRNNTQESFEEKYDYVPTELEPIYPSDPSIPQMPEEEDTHYEPASAKSLFNSDDRKESVIYISPITIHTEYRPYIPARQKNPAKLPVDTPARPPRKPSRERIETPPPPLPAPMAKTTEQATSLVRTQATTEVAPPLPPMPYTRGEPAGQESPKSPTKPVVDRTKRPVPSLPGRKSPPYDEKPPVRPTPIGRREMPLPELPPPDTTPPTNAKPGQRKTSINTNLNDYDWYHPKDSISDAKLKLSNSAKEGEFIIRPSQNNADSYSISIYANGKVSHLKLPFVDGVYRLGTSPQQFKSVPELICYYRKTRIVLTSGGTVLLRSDNCRSYKL